MEHNMLYINNINGQFLYSIYHSLNLYVFIRYLITLPRKASENIGGKEEYAGHHETETFSQCFFYCMNDEGHLSLEQHSFCPLKHLPDILILGF